MARCTVESGGLIFRQGDPADRAYLIEQGRVRVFLDGVGGPVDLAELARGELLGEMGVIDGGRRTASAEALDTCILLEVDRHYLDDRLEQCDPVIRALLDSQLLRYRAMLSAWGGQANAFKPRTSADGLALDKLRLESQLREALDAGQFRMHLQPIHDLQNDHLAGYEALMRWHHPVRGEVSPGEFVALAEETSLIVPMGEFMFEQAVAALVALGQGDSAPFVAVNVSARQLQWPGMLDALKARLVAHDVPPAALKLEITESQALDYAQVKQVMARCRALGIRVALDDFGTGFSNLSHLRALAFDTVKVDQSFLRDVETVPRARAMLRAIVDLVHATGADALVEGVETPGQLGLLREVGCRYAQGYLIGRPQPLEEILGWPEKPVR